MGNSHSDDSGSKPPDKGKGRQMAVTQPKSRTLCNTPYLTSMFKKLSEKSGTDSNWISQSVFEEAFNGPLKVLGRLLFKHIKNKSKEHKSDNSIHLDEFLRVSTEVLGLMSNIHHLNYYFDFFTEGADTMDVEKAYHMVQVCFSVSQAVAYLPLDLSEKQDKLLRSLASSIIGPHGALNKTDFVTWTSKHIPHLFNGVHSFFLVKLSGASLSDIDWHKRISKETHVEKNNLSDNTIAMVGSLDSSTSSLTYCLLWLLSACLPNLFTQESRGNGASKTSIVPTFLMSRVQMVIEMRPWCLLYNSDKDGLSVNGFESHVFSYKGPTISLITFDHNIYCLATDQEWRESSSYWGGESTVLYQLTPHFSCIARGRIIFLNHHTRGVFKGIQIGSDPKSPLIKIEDMSVVDHYGVQITLEAVEVWGCASNEIRNIQLRQHAWERKEVEKLHNRKLKLENWEDNPDRMLLNWVGISTNHHEKA